MNEILEQVRERVDDWKSELHFSRNQKRSLLVLFLIVIVISAAVVTRGRTSSVVIPPPAPLVITPANVTVDVAGGVKHPGVYSLPQDSRVIDAIAAAGGAKPGTDTSDLNLARLMKDGEQIYVEPVVSQSKAPLVIAPSKVRTGPININRATEKDFDSLPGVGPVIAARIVAYRKSNGPFLALEDLQKVSGIGKAKFAQFKNKIRV